jgi:hypothetical protein
MLNKPCANLNSKKTTSRTLSIAAVIASSPAKQIEGNGGCLSASQAELSFLFTIVTDFFLHCLRLLPWSLPDIFSFMNLTEIKTVCAAKEQEFY